MTQNKFQKNGFSLIDVVMAVAVISIGLIGVMSLLVQNIQASRVNKNFLVASMLAQEGIELVRNMRDDNWLDNPISDWYHGFYDGVSPVYTFAIDKNLYFNDSINIIDNAPLYLDGNNFYVHSGGQATVFRRLITIERDAGFPDYLTIKATVQWDNNIGSTRKYEVVSYLYNWR